jgi:PIN domain nuclease of toxin-antitoxin system
VNLLLDTHIWIWSLVDPDRLGRRMARELASPSNQLWLSPVSIWETMLLIERRRLEVDGSASEWVEERLRATPAREASLTHEVAIRSRQLRLDHADPADRFLAATAAVHGLTLATADDRLLGCPDIKTLPNR